LNVSAKGRVRIAKAARGLFFTFKKQKNENSMLCLQFFFLGEHNIKLAALWFIISIIFAGLNIFDFIEKRLSK